MFTDDDNKKRGQSKAFVKEVQMNSTSVQEEEERKTAWREAARYMPFGKATSMPWCVPSMRPIDEVEAKAMFNAYDADASGTLDKVEVKAVLLSAGVLPDRVDGVVQKMFHVGEAGPDGEPVEEEDMTWEVFRLWLRRDKFADRHLTGAEKVFYTLDDPSISKSAQIISFIVVLFIVVSVMAFLLETLPVYKKAPSFGEEPELTTGAFAKLEVCIVAIFTAEYFLRLLCFIQVRTFVDSGMTQVENYLDFSSSASNLWNVIEKANSDMTPSRKVWMFVTKPMNLIDLMAILPFYIELMLKDQEGGALVVLRILRLARLFRVLKLKKYSSGFDVFIQTLALSGPALSVLGFILSLLTIFFGALLYLAEGGTWYTPGDFELYCNETKPYDPICTEIEVGGYPEGAYMRYDLQGRYLQSSPFESVFDACWCVVVTMTTTGYGDIYPTSSLGRCVSTACMVIGVLAIAMPINVLGQNFNAEFATSLRKEVQRKEDVFEAIKIGLQEYKQRVPEQSHASKCIDLELAKMANARNMLLNTFLASDTSLALKDNSFRLDVLDQDVIMLHRKLDQTMDLIRGVSTKVVGAHSTRNLESLPKGASERRLDRSERYMMAISNSAQPSPVSPSRSFSPGASSRNLVDLALPKTNVTGIRKASQEGLSPRTPVTPVTPVTPQDPLTGTPLQPKDVQGSALDDPNKKFFI